MRECFDVFSLFFKKDALVFLRTALLSCTRNIGKNRIRIHNLFGFFWFFCMSDNGMPVQQKNVNFSLIYGNFGRNRQIRAEQKKICIYSSIRYYEIHWVMGQEQDHVKGEDL